MTDHLPECPGNWGVGQMPDGPCTFCDMLRACEQRVLSLNPVALGVLIAQRARERALDAAREAVAGLPEVAGWTGELAIIRKPIALDAIDALKEKP